MNNRHLAAQSHLDVRHPHTCFERSAAPNFGYLVAAAGMVLVLTEEVLWIYSPPH